MFLALLALAAWTTLVEPRWVARRELQAVLPALEAGRTLRVAVAADWHLTRRALWRVMTFERARAIVDEINAAGPDLILLPGDFIADCRFKGPDAAQAADLIAAELGRLRARLGVYAVLGNHDWCHGGVRFAAALGRHGIVVLENEARPVTGARLWIVGIGDHLSGRSAPAQALRQLPPGVPTLVMMHDPASMLDLPRVAGLAMAAHTHGGQVSVPFLGALHVPGAAPRAWAHGWVAHGDNRMYVTSGLGVSDLPVRFNMRPEWVLFTLSAPEEGAP